MYPAYNDQALEAPHHSQIERTIVRHIQSLCRINPRSSFEDSVAVAEKIRSTLKLEVQKIGEIAKDFREKYYAMEQGNPAADGALEAQLYEFEKMTLKQKIGTFWEKNPNFMERVKQHRVQKREEEPRNQADQRRPLPSQIEQKPEPIDLGINQQMPISSGIQNGQFQHPQGEYQQLQSGQDPLKPMENVFVHQNGIQRPATQQGQPVHDGSLYNDNQAPSRPGPVAQSNPRLLSNQHGHQNPINHRQNYQSLYPSQSSHQSSEPVVITLDSDPESPPLPYQQVVMPVDIQSAGGMARKRYPVKRAAPQTGNNYGNCNKQQAMTGRNYPAMPQQPAQSAPVRYRIVTNFPPGHQMPSNGQQNHGENMNSQQMERQGAGQQQLPNGIVQQGGGQISRGRVVRYPRGRQPVLRGMTPVALIPPPVPLVAPQVPQPASAPQEQLPTVYNDQNNGQNQENCQDFDVDPEELAKAFFQ